ncbi:helix-turn-helix transcriptional regulator [Fluviicola sp.]|jgi:transcriptional regulator with XRE-family HTH domain|uniref:helix-turn-helix domain-containing protein n=1 Tax=Fluviicola sp. TaxID=1917219 RepID=UPI00281A7EF9|nr:helix-turn-helix transcriptional regulator [Fluviicola sp.]MDR0803249.1 helix-turn-helix domain-containing protein [Fluviicola sp.]
MGEAILAVGHKIRGVRKMKDLSQDYLAIKLGTSQSAVSKIENNETMISYETLLDISKGLDSSINEILNFESSTIYNSNNNQSGGFSGANNTYYTFNAEEISRRNKEIS